jgi:pyridoxamine 5'-phosphate oxidase
MVLLRGVDHRGFCFYTNFESRKGDELAANPRAAIAFHWPEVLRQVRATGRVERVSDAESDAYWYSRPRASRVSAWASAQSVPVATREELEARVEELEERFAGVEVPRPDGWGGFRVVPDEIEFWQHRDDRLHDRFVYTRSDVSSGADWQVVRLQP